MVGERLDMKLYDGGRGRNPRRVPIFLAEFRPSAAA
jgi:hypothetical protein